VSTDARSADEIASPFSGIRVLDLSRIIAGPLVGQILAGLGAEVIKIEDPSKGDFSRGYLAQGDTTGMSPLFTSLNRDKKSVTLDLKKSSDVDKFLSLVDTADVLVQNFRPGVMDRLGIGYSTLSKRNERLIFCSISGFGSAGPLRDHPANDVIAQAFAGIMSFTGDVNGDPVRCGPSVADMTAGLYATVGIVSALYSRTETGRGQEVSTSLLESALSLVAHNLVEYWFNGYVPTPMGSGTRMGLPNRAFPSSDGAVIIAAVNEAEFGRLSALIGRLDLSTDTRFHDLSARRRNRDELDEIISSWTRQRTTGQCVALLEGADVLCGPINDISQIAKDSQVSSLGMIQDVGTAKGESQRLVALPLSFNGVRPRIRRVAPDLGEHTDEVILHEKL
jgi:crotonobetainyl-CoA:carnitine CoA-transferase CaiB-like acyl-CoA transferase